MSSSVVIRRLELIRDGLAGSGDDTQTRYAREIALRHEVLRQPLGFAPEDWQRPLDSTAWHWLAEHGERVVGCVLFHFEAADKGRLFQMAVAPELHNAGVGRCLVQALERDVAAAGVREVTLHAREAAVGFYLKLGYEVFGEPFEEVTLLHRHMHKRLG